MYVFCQAGDGKRGNDVTGVQTCALPILHAGPHGVEHVEAPLPPGPFLKIYVIRAVPQPDRLLLVEPHEVAYAVAAPDRARVHPIIPTRERDQIGTAACRERV